MGIDDTENKKNRKKRLSLGDVQATIASLCKLARQYHNDEIPDNKIRNLTYILNSIIGGYKVKSEIEYGKRIEQLESYIRGEGGTIVDQKDIDNPYAQDLKKQLGNEQKINMELNNEILNLKRQLAKNRAAPTDLNSVGVV